MFHIHTLFIHILYSLDTDSVAIQTNKVEKNVMNCIVTSISNLL